MKKINIKIGDKVEMWNGTKGIIQELTPNYLVKVVNCWFHVMDIKFINGIEFDETNFEINLD